MRAPSFTNDMVRINNTFSFAHEDDISYIDALKPLPGAVTIKIEQNEIQNNRTGALISTVLASKSHYKSNK